MPQAYNALLRGGRGDMRGAMCSDVSHQWTNDSREVRRVLREDTLDSLQGEVPDVRGDYDQGLE